MSPREARFVAAYFETGSPGKAYKQVYAQPGTAFTSCSASACKVLRQPAVAAEVAERKSAMIEAACVDRTALVARLSDIAHTNIFDFLYQREGDSQWYIRDPSELTVEQQRCIKSIKTVRGKDDQILEYALTLHDANQAARTLASMFPAEQAVGDVVGFNIVINTGEASDSPSSAPQD